MHAERRWSSAQYESELYRGSRRWQQLAAAALQQLETKRAAAEQALEAARAEERNLRGNIPALNKELATVTATVAALVAQRDDTSQFVTRMNVDTDASRKRLAELQAIDRVGSPRIGRVAKHAVGRVRGAT